MRNIQLIALVLVVAGSFLPLVHIPLIGNWNYWQTDQRLAIACWLFSILALVGILTNRQKAVKTASVLLLLLFVFTIIAVKFQAWDFFSFLPFKSIQKSAAGLVALREGWLMEFAGALLLLLVRKN